MVTQAMVAVAKAMGIGVGLTFSNGLWRGIVPGVSMITASYHGDLGTWHVHTYQWREGREGRWRRTSTDGLLISAKLGVCDAIYKATGVITWKL